MFSDNNARTPKRRLEIELRTVEGEVLEGSIFVTPDQRVVDLLNTDNRFIAFEATNGSVEIINKVTIARVRPIERPAQQQAASL
jgi:hypothetical protein